MSMQALSTITKTGEQQQRKAGTQAGRRRKTLDWVTARWQEKRNPITSKAPMTSYSISHWQDKALLKTSLAKIYKQTKQNKQNKNKNQQQLPHTYADTHVSSLWMLCVPATRKTPQELFCLEVYVLPHCDKGCISNSPTLSQSNSHPVTVN